MSVLKGKELRVVGFLCNWCSYGGADTAGVARLTQPTDLRIIRVPCSGRVNPLFPLRALLAGADGVLVSGCHPRDCHYSEGNFYARRRLQALKEFLPIVGIDPQRFEYTWVSASEGPRWQQVVTNFVTRIHKLGPAPKFEDVTPTYDLPDVKPNAPLRQLGCGVNPSLAELKDQIKKALEAKEVEFVMGWQVGHDPLHTTPLFMRTPEDVEKLVWGPLNLQTLANFLPLYKGKKVGVVVKGCDSKGIAEQLCEGLINREDVVVFGMGCNGTVDINRVMAKIGNVSHIESVEGSGATLKVVADGQTFELPMIDIAQDKCRACTVPNAVIQDHFAGKPTQVPEGATPEIPAILSYFDGLTLEQRMSFWRGQIERCIRCFACRSACPMCVCRDQCVSDSREPHWLTQENSATQKMFFQLIHAMHLTGRCTGCGECSRACPMGIPINLLKLQINRVVKKLFDYEPGMDPAANPPLLGFELEEKNIHEHEIEA